MTEHDHELDVELSQILLGRAAFYDFLSYVLQKPADRNILDLIKEFTPYFEAVAAETDIDDLKAGALELSTFTNGIEHSDAFIAKLGTAFTSLFVGEDAVAACQSAWFDYEGMMDELKELYSEAELELVEGFDGREDHICIELQYMAHLARECADALDTASETDTEDSDKADVDAVANELMAMQDDFLEVELVEWAPNFAQAVIEKCTEKNLPLYSAIAHLLAGFIEYDMVFMDAMKDGMEDFAEEEEEG